MPNQQELNQIKESIRELFTASNLNAAIKLDSLFPISLESAQRDPQLNRFFRLDEDGPFSEINRLGVQSLRKGYYKITSRPYYRTNISPATFAAEVYYYSVGNDNLILYTANIGPLVNTSMKYFPFNTAINESQIPILKKFSENKAYDDPATYYYESKRRFFDTVFDENRIILVHEAGWDPAFPDTNRRKQIKWSFLDF